MRHKNPLEVFPYGHPPPPWKIRQIDTLPLEKSDPFRGGGGKDIFWNHIMTELCHIVKKVGL